MFRIIPLAIATAGLSAAAVAAPGIQMAQANTQARPAAQAPKPVAKADFTKAVDGRFSALDTNKDGFVDKAEIAAAQAKVMQAAAAQQQQRLENDFKKLDTNKDNQLSLAEFKAVAPPIRNTESADQTLAKLDSNKDGKISAQEFRAPQLAAFDKADANKDGTITPQEAQAARRQ